MLRDVFTHIPFEYHVGWVLIYSCFMEKKAWVSGREPVDGLKPLREQFSIVELGP